MSTVRLHRHDGAIVVIEVPMFEICKVASAMYTRMRIHKPHIRYPEVLEIVLTNFYAREAGSTYRVSMTPFTEATAPSVPPTMDSELQTLLQQLPQEMKYEIMSRMDGTSIPALRATSAAVTKMLPAELQYAHLIPWSCLQWVLQHPSTHQQAVIDVTLPLIGDALHYIDATRCSTEQLYHIAVELQFRGKQFGYHGNYEIHDFKTIMDRIANNDTSGIALYMSALDNPRLYKRSLQQIIDESPQAIQQTTEDQDDIIPIPGTNAAIYLTISTDTGIFVKQGQSIKIINDAVFRYKLAVAMPQHRDKILHWRYPHTKKLFAKAVGKMTLIHDTIEDLVTHGELVRELLK